MQFLLLQKYIWTLSNNFGKDISETDCVFKLSARVSDWVSDQVRMLNTKHVKLGNKGQMWTNFVLVFYMYRGFVLSGPGENPVSLLSKFCSPIYRSIEKLIYVSLKQDLTPIACFQHQISCTFNMAYYYKYINPIEWTLTPHRANGGVKWMLLI